MQQPLTVRQREILTFISDEIREKGVAPSLQEIGARFELSALATIHKHLETLKTKGYIQRRRSIPRSITLLCPGACPTCGQKVPTGEDSTINPL